MIFQNRHSIFSLSLSLLNLGNATNCRKETRYKKIMKRNGKKHIKHEKMMTSNQKCWCLYEPDNSSELNIVELEHIHFFYWNLQIQYSLI